MQVYLHFENVSRELRKSIVFRLKKKNRIEVIERWMKTGGVMIMGYDMFRSIIERTSASGNEEIYCALQDPG